MFTEFAYEKLDSKMDAGFREMDARFAKVDGRFARLERKSIRLSIADPEASNGRIERGIGQAPLRRDTDPRALPQNRLLIERFAVRLDDRLHRLPRWCGIGMNQQHHLRLLAIDAAGGG